MSSVAIVGANGFVGSALATAFGEAGWLVTRVTRETYDTARAGAYDVVVNAAMPSGRFWAKNEPAADFVETVQKTADLYHGWRYRRFIQISSISARSQLDTVYGRHKAAAEAVCGGSETLVVRLGPMYGPTLTKGVLIDMIHGRPVFAAAESRYCFAPLDFVAGWIAKNTQRRGIAEVGAQDSLSLVAVARHLHRDIAFHGAPDHQEVAAPEPDFPLAAGALDFVDHYRKENFV